MILSRPALVATAAAALMTAFSACDSSSGTTPTPPTTAVPAPTPTPTPTPDPLAALKAQCGQPMPTPLYGIKVSVQLDNGFRKLVDSRPIVINEGQGTTNSYCGKIGFDSRAPYCDTRPEGHPQREACDILVVGRASDTGRYGPDVVQGRQGLRRSGQRERPRLHQPRGQPVPRCRPWSRRDAGVRLRRLARGWRSVRRLLVVRGRRPLRAVTPVETRPDCDLTSRRR